MPLYNPYVPSSQAPAPPSAPPKKSAQTKRQKNKTLTVQQMLEHPNPKIRKAIKQAIKEAEAKTALQTEVPKILKGLGTKYHVSRINIQSKINAQQAFWKSPEFRQIVAEAQKIEKGGRYKTYQREVQTEIREATLRAARAVPPPVSPTQLEMRGRSYTAPRSTVQQQALQGLINSGAAQPELIPVASSD